jgi:hypothetical protein
VPGPSTDPCNLIIQRQLTGENIGALFEPTTYKDRYPQYAAVLPRNAGRESCATRANIRS